MIESAEVPLSPLITFQSGLWLKIMGNLQPLGYKDRRDFAGHYCQGNFDYLISNYLLTYYYGPMCKIYPTSTKQKRCNF